MRQPSNGLGWLTWVVTLAVLVVLLVPVGTVVYMNVTTWLVPRPVFSEGRYWDGIFRWSWPHDFEDGEGNVFFADADWNAVAIVRSECPLLGKEGRDGIVFAPRAHAIVLTNDDDRTLQVELRVARDHCYVVGKDLSVRVLEMPTPTVGRSIKQLADKDKYVTGFRLGGNILEELRKRGVEVLE